MNNNAFSLLSVVDEDGEVVSGGKQRVLAFQNRTVNNTVKKVPKTKTDDPAQAAAKRKARLEKRENHNRLDVPVTETKIEDWKIHEKINHLESKFLDGNNTQYAVARLLRDLREIEAEPLKTVSALPVQNNMFLWHCNIRPFNGPYAGVTLHAALKFPETYPNMPPTLELLTPIPHSNVFGSYVCMDMLQTPSSRYVGSTWSSAYSVQSILLQLQSFLTAENIPQQYGDDRRQVNETGIVDRTKHQIDSFRCYLCGHTYEAPYPPLPPPDLDPTSRQLRLPPRSMSPMVPSVGNILNLEDASKELEIDRATMLTCAATQSKGWFGVRAHHGFRVGGSLRKTLYYEVEVAGSGVSRVGFSIAGGSYDLGRDWRGFGYGGTGKKSHNNQFIDYGEGFRKGDIIGCALDLSSGDIVFWRNGRCMGKAFTVPKSMYLKTFYPTVSVRNMRFRLNFGAQKFRYSPEELSLTELPLKPTESMMTSFRERYGGKRNNTNTDNNDHRTGSSGAGGAFVPPSRAGYKLDITVSRDGKVSLESHRFSANDLLVRAHEELQSRIDQSSGNNNNTNTNSSDNLNNKKSSVPDTNPFARLPMEVIAYLFDHYVPSLTDLLALKSTCVLFRRAIERFFLLQRHELICFFSHDTFRDTELGLAVSIRWSGEYLVLGDILSFSSFNRAGVRKSFDGKQFNQLFPLIIDESNIKKFKVIPHLQHILCRLSGEQILKPGCVLSVVPKLMSSVINQFYQQTKNTDVKPFVSSRTLFNYLSFEHMLLALDLHTPGVELAVDAKLDQLIRDPQLARSIELDELLCASVVSSHRYNWNDLKQVMFDELIRRNVAKIWVSDLSALDVRGAFQSLLVSVLRPFMMHVVFVRTFGKRKGSKEHLWRLLNQSRAMVNEQMELALSDACNRVNSVGDWQQLLQFWSLPSMSDQAVSRYLWNVIQTTSRPQTTTTPTQTPKSTKQ